MKYATIVEPIFSEDVKYNFSEQIEVKKVDFVVNTVCSIMHESWKAEKGHANCNWPLEMPASEFFTRFPVAKYLILFSTCKIQFGLEEKLSIFPSFSQYI